MTGIGENVASYRIRIPESGAEIELAWAVATDTGHKRKHNEDSFVAAPPLFAVADGMGGHSAGDLASHAVVTRIAEAASGDFAEPPVIEAALKRATADISEVVDEAHMGVGTTATGASLVLVDGVPHWSVFNVGDSRVYVSEGGRLTQVTVDHSVVQELVDAGMITAREAEHHPDSNIITRAVGFNVDAVPDYWQLPVRAGMRLILCSDGLTKEVEGAELSRLVAEGGSAAELADELVLRALAAGGRDNVTVVIVDVVSAPEIPVAQSGAVPDAVAEPDSELEEDTIPKRAVAERRNDAP